MANGFKVFSTGEVLTAADVNDYLMEQSIGIFANSTARDAQITSPIEGQFCYLADSNVLQLYNGSSWAGYIDEGDISSVVAGTNISGGGTSGAVTLNLAIDAAVAFADQTASAIILKDYAETDVAVTSATTLAINLANGNTGTVTLGHATAKTPGAAGLTLSTAAAKIDLLTFLFVDAGTPLLNSLLDFS